MCLTQPCCTGSTILGPLWPTQEVTICVGRHCAHDVQCVTLNWTQT